MRARGWRRIAERSTARSVCLWSRHGTRGGIRRSVHVCSLVTASRSALPAVNDGTVDPAMAMLSPVRGFGPRWAGRCLAVRFPQPARATGSPRASASANGNEHGANHPVGSGLGQKRLCGDVGGELGSVHVFSPRFTCIRTSAINPDVCSLFFRTPSAPTVRNGYGVASRSTGSHGARRCPGTAVSWVGHLRASRPRRPFH